MLDLISAGFDKLLIFTDNLSPLHIYLFLLLMAFLENVFPPVPGDTCTIAAGYLAATGKLELFATLAVISLGTISSVMLVYIIGWYNGRAFLSRHPSIWFRQRDLKRVDSLFASYGDAVMLLSRFIVGIRVAIAVAAGVGKYPPGRMLFYTVLSTLAFHGLLIGIAYLLYHSISGVVTGVSIYSKIILALAAILVILWVILIMRRFMYERKKV